MALVKDCSSCFQLPGLWRYTLSIRRNGQDTGDCTNTACETLDYAFSQMSPNDTLEIAAGTYTGASNMIGCYSGRDVMPPSGQGGNYTVVRAENAGKVIFEGEGTTPTFFVNNTSLQCVQFEGLIWKNCDVDNAVIRPNVVSLVGNTIAHVKFIRCRAARGPFRDSHNAIHTDGADYYPNASAFNGSSNSFCDSNGNEFDPLAGDPASLIYSVCVETGSAANEAGENGANIGATIIKRYGAPGTLWGEPGYNSLTDDDLWPFPHENQIREVMQGYSPTGGPMGARGFCAPGKTLTTYIWEYLENAIP